MNDITTNQTIYPTLFDLFQYWCNDNYPDYVTGIWSNDGSAYNLTVGVTNNETGEAGKQEILSLIEDDSSVTFVTQTYSRNYLRQIQDELLPYFKQDLGLVSTGVSEMENFLDVEILTEKATDQATLNFIAELQQKYSDAVSISYTEGYALTTEEIGIINPLAPSTGRNSSSSPLLIAGVIIIMIPLLVFGLYFILRKRFVPVMQTNDGGTVARTDTLSVKEVEKIIKDSSLTVSKEVDEKMMAKIENLGK